MQIIISSQGDDLDAKVDPRFGRASQFILVNTDTMDFKVIENNQNLDMPQGAGIQAAQAVTKHKPNAVLTGNCGPKAFKALQAAGVDIIVGVNGSIREAVQGYIDGKYQTSDGANVEGHWM